MLCRECGSDRLRPSPPRGPLEAAVRAWTKTRYHECAVCGMRARFPRSPRDSSDPGVDVLFWLAVVLLGVGFIFLLLRVG